MDDNARELARRLAERGILVIEELYAGLRVTTRSHVGHVRVGSLVVTIEPKLAGDHLIELLRYAYGLHDLRQFDTAPLAKSGTLLQDLLGAQLLFEASELRNRGLAKTYVDFAETLSSPRGRLDMSAVLRRMPLRDAALHCRHHERATDHLLNRVLLAGVQLAARIVSDASLRQSLRRLAARLAEYASDVTLTPVVLDHARRRVDRLTAAYRPALRLIEILVAGESLALDDGDVAVPGFLFDMNRFFQTLIGRFLKEHLDDVTVDEEQALVAMMRYAAAKNPRGRRPPRPRPDFRIARRGRTVALLDAKYRDLWARDLPRDMLYQLAIYALSQPRGATAAILFPTTSAHASEAVVEIADPVRDDTVAYVALRPVVLERLTSALRAPGSTMSQRRLAHELAFGAVRPVSYAV